MKLYWTTPAQRDLGALWAYIYRDSPSAAASVVDRIEEVALVLVEQPGAGRLGREPDTRELVVTRTPYILIYEVAPEGPRVLRVIHASQQWPPAQ